jgi:hypothetical protein
MRWGLVAGLAVLSLSLPAWLPIFTIQLTVRGLYLGIVTMTFILLAGYADMISLAQMSFAAISGYVIAIGTVRLGLSHGVLVPLAILAAVALSALFGLVAIRGRKIYFLMMTLALGQLFYGVGTQWVGLQAAGFETVTFHANGSGGRTMEEMIADGLIDGVVDYTVSELTDEYLGGTFTAGPHRLEAAGRAGIPQLILPGAIEVLNFGPRASVPERFDRPERRLIVHNTLVSAVRTTLEEGLALAGILCDKAN